MMLGIATETMVASMMMSATPTEIAARPHQRRLWNRSLLVIP